MPEIYDVVIIGGGPAGLGAALYASRGLHSTLVLEQATPGGQIVHTERVDDYPGHPEGIGGPQLAKAMWNQAMRFGAQTITAQVSGLEVRGPLKVVASSAGEFLARTVIVATGGVPRRLEVPGAQTLEGRGVSYNALIDPAKHEGAPAIVVGGGDTAFSQALYLAKRASKVTIVHRRQQFRAIEALQDAVFANDNIKVITDAVVEEILGQDWVNGVQLKDLKSGVSAILEAKSVFIAIGFRPNTALISGLIPLQPSGHVPTDEWLTTPLPGVFVAGDVREYSAGQVISAAGDGATAAIAADHYLAEAHDSE